jgi:two-component system LytT family response regulator
MTQTPIRVVIAEDEELAREKLARWVNAEKDLNLVGEASDGPGALALVQAENPDLLFLDVRMPGLSGLEVLDRIEEAPYVIFTTAYDTHAVAAFDLEAVDYLVKPFGPARFQSALDRLRKRMATPKDLAEARVPMLNVVETGKVRTIPIEDVWRFEGSGDYVAAWVAGKRYLLTARLGSLARKLDGRFLAVHRSHLINVNFVKEFVSLGNGRWRAMFPDGSYADSSRSGGRLIREYLADL